MTGMKLLFCLFAAVCFGVVAAYNSGSEKCRDMAEWRPMYDPTYALAVLAGSFLLLTLILGRQAGRAVAVMGLSLFAHTMVYDCLLLLALPWLRRVFSAGCCASLWLLPNLLMFGEHAILQNSRPRLVIPVDPRLSRWVLGIWGLGAGAVLLWQVAEHLRCRRQLLRGAEDAVSPAAKIWEDLCHEARLPRVIPLLRAPAATAPVTIGLFGFSRRVLLPPREYTAPELALILRHEMYHIKHRDIAMKFFLAVTLAVGWFNPLMWLARRRCSEDLELGCDEEILQGAEPEQRRDYARLILSAAGEDRGFTSCLSAGAKGLRYRLGRIVHPKTRLSGSLLMAVLIFVLLASYGLVDISFRQGALGEFHPQMAHEEIKRVHAGAELIHGSSSNEVTDWDGRLAGAVAQLRVQELSRSYDFDATDSPVKLQLLFQGQPNSVILHEDYVHVHDYRAEGRKSLYYLYDEEPDWEALMALLRP